MYENSAVHYKYSSFQVDKTKAGGVYTSSTKRFQDPKEVLPGPGHYKSTEDWSNLRASVGALRQSNKKVATQKIKHGI